MTIFTFNTSVNDNKPKTETLGRKPQICGNLSTMKLRNAKSNFISKSFYLVDSKLTKCIFSVTADEF